MGSRINRSKGTVNFIFRDSKKSLEQDKNRESPILLRFYFGATNRIKYSTGYKSCYNDWDFSKQRIKNKIGIQNKDQINGFLSSLETYILKTYSELSLEKKEVTAEMLKAKLDAFARQKERTVESSGKSFFQIIDKYINERHGHISIVTERSYKQTKKQLQSFEKYRGQKLSFDDIDTSFHLQFKSYLEKEKFSLNTIGKHIKSVRTFCNYALQEGYTQNNKFKNNGFKAPKETTTEIYLTEEEIKQMHDKDLSAYPDLEHARDIFLIGCYTGQRVSDYNYLTKDDIVEKEGIRYFKIRQKKNRKYSRVVFCPITKQIQEIMDKRHNGEPPKRMAEALLNDYLKQIGKDLKFNERIKCEFTKGGKHQTKMLPKHDLIKTHTARRSFCTNKYKAGMNVFDIMLFSGHTTEKEFYKYIRIRDEERASHVAKSGFFDI